MDGGICDLELELIEFSFIFRQPETGYGMGFSFALFRTLTFSLHKPFVAATGSCLFLFFFFLGGGPPNRAVSPVERKEERTWLPRHNQTPVLVHEG